MKTRLILLLLCFLLPGTRLSAQNVTVAVHDAPAADVFRSLMAQTGKNFVYEPSVFDNVKVTVEATDTPLPKVLAKMFQGTGIEYRIKGDNVTVKPGKRFRKATPAASPARPKALPYREAPTALDEVVVTSRLEAPAVETPHIGAHKISGTDIANTPVLLGETDVIKAIHTQPGVVEGNEGLAGMYVHGGNADENMYMLDNVPLYQANHLAGFFSAFNADVVRHVDFYKSSMPAKYDGRLSSFLDVRTKAFFPDGHHGSARLGLTSGAFNIAGPIDKNTSYLAAVRRSWFDVISVPILALANSLNSSENTRFRYAFTDLNAKITHRFSPKVNGFVSAYYGNDLLNTGSKTKDGEYTTWLEDDRARTNWGNIVAQAGLNYAIHPALKAEFTAAFTRFFSSIRHTNELTEKKDGYHVDSRSDDYTQNNIHDWILRGDFNWNPSEASAFTFGLGYTRHSFLPSRTSREYSVDKTETAMRDSAWVYRANELNAYAEANLRAGEKIRLSAGLHASLFNISPKTHTDISPRISAAWQTSPNTAVKAAYSRTVQYVHQLQQTQLNLPVDQWIPVTGPFKPSTADKISLGAYWNFGQGSRSFEFSAEAYLKRMHNLLEYRQEYYVRQPLEAWDGSLTQGRGSAKGIDLKFAKTIGTVTGHVAYSLAWADRTFAGKNNGRTYPARFDNRHSINILVNWKASEKVQLNASWTGHSGNRFTFMPQMWNPPAFGDMYYPSYPENNYLRTPLNNYRLPFYHRLDLSCMVQNSRGFWNFSLYNAYCHMNAVGITRGYSYPKDFSTGWKQTPRFEKVSFLPIIPSVSYTWIF